MASSHHSSVAEMQGLYGPFTLTERVVQKIWLRGDFARRSLVLTDGRRLEIRSGGAWNLLGGPDFRGARLVMGGEEVVGDIEVHFHATDWLAHGHAHDPAYRDVVLHVVLFPPDAGSRGAAHADGRLIPTLVLLPCLHRDLEEYASDDALEVMTERDTWERFAELAAMVPAEMKQVLQQQAVARWRQKVHFAKLRVSKLGFDGAAHHTALEILGYRRNRATMLAVAAQQPLETWGSGADVAAIFEAMKASWQLQGVRPANHPRTRLAQYAAWVRDRPDWPQRLARQASRLAVGAELARWSERPRQALGLAELRRELAEELTGGAVGGSRFDNLMCDGFLPLAATVAEGNEGFATWFHWFLGDVPAQVRAALPKLGVTGRNAQPNCHGWAQGLLGWLLEHDARASH